MQTRRGRLHGGGSSASGSRSAARRRWRSSRTATSSAPSLRQRWCIEPELLVLDEPFAGLDPLAVRTLAEVLRGEAARGAAVVFSSHQLELVEDICEDVVIIDHGRIVTTGTVDALRRGSYRRRIELELEGASPMAARRSPASSCSSAVTAPFGCSRDRDVDPDMSWPRRSSAARVVAFSYGPPSLAELFVELIES